MTREGQETSKGVKCKNKAKYNGKNKREVKYSEDFMENMESFFCEALFINHVNFSGMNFEYE